MEKEYDFSGGVRGPPRYARAVLKATGECTARYGKVAVMHANGWAFFMPQELLARVQPEDLNVEKLMRVADISIDPTGRVMKHRWRLPNAP